MKVEEIIKKNNEAKKLKKEYDFSQHITRRYMPYSEKCSLVKSIVNNTSYPEFDEDGVPTNKSLYRRDTASMLFCFTMQLITNYTDLEFEHDEVVQVYDALMESGVMNCIMTEIPEEEIKILRGMLDMQRDDEEANFHSLVSFFETKTEAIQLAIESFGKAFEKPEIQAKIAELMK